MIALGRAQGERGALLLDLDGVLFESEPLHERAWAASLAAVGARPPEGWYAPQRGRSLMDVARSLAAAYAPSASAQELAERKNAAYQELAAGLPPAPGVPEALAALDVRAAVVSSSLAPDVFVLLRGSALERSIELVVTGSDTPAHKPAPDLYLLALRRLGLAADRCAAVEDSVSGVRAARAAELRVVAVGDDPRVLEHATASRAAAAEAIREAGRLILTRDPAR